MADSIKTPFGMVPKKQALIFGGIAGVVLLIGYYRYRQQKLTSAAGSNEINPATGYPFGSAEDAAALSTQNGYQYPATGGGGGGGGSSGGTSIPGTGYVNNAQWSQAAIEYLTNSNSIVDSGALSAALGKYINGSPVTNTEKTLIEQAIAVVGQPPVAGPSGYPPHINQSPIQAATLPAKVSGFTTAGIGFAEIDLKWDAVQGAERYEIYRLGTAGTAKGQGSEVVSTHGTSAKIFPLAGKSTYKFTIWAINSAGKGPASDITATTK